MQRAVNGGWFTSDVLDDVDFSAFRPADVFDVGAEHPERRPQSLAVRDLDARFKSAVRRREAVQGFEARGRVFSRDAIGTGVAFLKSSDEQLAALNRNILRRSI